jgi:hypothetical protein
VSLTCAEVAARVRYRPETIRALARDGRFPSPIDPELHPRLWRWSQRSIEIYEDGRWVVQDSLGLQTPVSPSDRSEPGSARRARSTVTHLEEVPR